MINNFIFVGFFFVFVHRIFYVLYYSLIIKSSATLDVKCDQRFPSVCIIGTTIELLFDEELNISPVEHEHLVNRFEIVPASDLKYFPQRIFQTFPHLESVTLNSANINNITQLSFVNANHLQDLHLKRNKITIITNSLFMYAPDLEHLDLSGNEIAEIENGGFSELKKLSTLKLNDNRLKILKSQTFSGAPAIKYLHLYSNQVEIIESNALNLPELMELFLGHNQLRSLNDDLLNGTPKLEVIDLSDNLITGFDNVFSNCHKMYWLNIGNNNIGHIDLKIFSNLRALSSLSLNNTNFSFPIILNRNERIVTNTSLESLNLANNNLSNSDIFEHLTIFTELQRLYLYNNEFTHFKNVTEIKQLLPKLNTLDLTGNKRISQWLRSNLDTFKRERISLMY